MAARVMQSTLEAHGAASSIHRTAELTLTRAIGPAVLASGSIPPYERAQHCSFKLEKAPFVFARGQ
eukprot:5929419-Pleurochrysis_carterae.AAC.1